MTIKEISVQPYSLKFKKSFHTSKSILTNRKGLLIAITNTDGLTGIGDCAPLPAFGSESFEEAEKQINSILEIFPKEFQISSINSVLPLSISLPTVKSAFEQALMDLYSKEMKIPLLEQFPFIHKKEIEINTVIGFASPENTFELATQKIEAGYKTIKLKIGRDDFNNDLSCIKSVQKTLKEGCKLRLDVNGKWSPSEAEKNFSKLKYFNIEYIEQPVESVKDFPELQAATKIPLATDESLRSSEDAFEIINNNLAQVLILKPMLLGGFLNTLEIILLAEKNNKRTVISSSFESSVGKRNLVLLASLIKGDVAHGISVNEYFDDELVPDIYPVFSGRIIL